MRAELGYLEIAAGDPGRLARFFAEVFDWGTEPVPWSEGEYLKVRWNDGGSGPVGAGIVRRPATGIDGTLPVLHIHGEPLSACLRRIEAAGGAVLEQPRTIDDYGAFARFRDPEGNAWGLWSAVST